METCYISLEAAFQAIEDIDENAGARGSGFTDPERIMRDSAFYALEAIQPADVVPAPRWIPVEDRLPEEGEMQWFGQEATHWMPLPQPPKEGGGENE